MTIDEAIKIKEHNKHRGILYPTDKDFEADDLSIEALKGLQALRRGKGLPLAELLPGETKD